ncbi:MAG: hypothetical protein CMJ32_11185 [Phycisphaerae bacterium]|nr:hypothetical protein [Phycisphaerae bacterium]
MMRTRKVRKDTTRNTGEQDDFTWRIALAVMAAAMVAGAFLTVPGSPQQVVADVQDALVGKDVPANRPD